MAPPLSSTAAAAAAARDLTCYMLRIRQSEADRFDQPGWSRLEPARDGYVVFIHRERELLMVRTRGVI